MFLQQIASHGLFDLDIEAEGDTWIDDHHTNEDLGKHLQAEDSPKLCHSTMMQICQNAKA